MDIQEPEFTAEQVRSVLFTQDAGNQCQSNKNLWRSSCSCTHISKLRIHFLSKKIQTNTFAFSKFLWFKNHQNTSLMLELSGYITVLLVIVGSMQKHSVTQNYKTQGK